MQIHQLKLLELALRYVSVRLLRLWESCRSAPLCATAELLMWMGRWMKDGVFYRQLCQSRSFLLFDPDFLELPESWGIPIRKFQRLEKVVVFQEKSEFQALSSLACHVLQRGSPQGMRAVWRGGLIHEKNISAVVKYVTDHKLLPLYDDVLKLAVSLKGDERYDFL